LTIKAAALWVYEHDDHDDDGDEMAAKTCVNAGAPVRTVRRVAGPQVQCINESS